MAFAVEPTHHDESTSLGGGDPKKSTVVLEELDRILSSRFFLHAGRSRQFLQYIVTQGLSGHPEQLKERTIGTEVFGRPPGYATGDDPVVRVQAGEVRRRLEQYYQEVPNGGPVRIELPVGSYVPRLHWGPEEIDSHSPAPHPLPQPSGVVSQRFPRWAVLGSLAALMLVVALGITVNLRRAPVAHSALDQFWAPILATQQPVLICLAKGVTYRPGPALYQRYERTHPGAFQTEVQRSSEPLQLAPSETMTWGDLHYYDGYGVANGDVTTAVRLATLFGKMGKPDQLRIGSAYTFVDLRNSPAVVVGAFNNKWTMDITSNLHFAFVEENGQFKIREQVRNGRTWVVPQFGTTAPRDKDYAIVARLMDSKTGQFTVIAAGIEDRGTEAAGEFVADPEMMEKGLRDAPKDWPQKNVELVLETRITDETAGPPQVVASYYW